MLNDSLNIPIERWDEILQFAVSVTKELVHDHQHIPTAIKQITDYTDNPNEIAILCYKIGAATNENQWQEQLRKELMGIFDSIGKDN